MHQLVLVPGWLVFRVVVPLKGFSDFSRVVGGVNLAPCPGEVVFVVRIHAAHLRDSHFACTFSGTGTCSFRSSALYQRISPSTFDGNSASRLMPPPPSPCRPRFGNLPRSQSCLPSRSAAVFMVSGLTPNSSAAAFRYLPWAAQAFR